MKNTILTFAFLFSVLCSVAQSSHSKTRVVFGDLTHEGPYDRSEILLQDKLSIASEDENTYQIASYHLTILPAKGQPIRFEVPNNKLPVRLQTSLNQIVGGDKILIESVFAKMNGNENNIVELEPITLEVKGYKNEDPYKRAYPKSNTSPKIANSLVATFGNIDLNNPVSIEDIVEQTEVGVFSKDDLDYKVTSFKMIVAFKNKPAILMSSSSNQLTTNMKEVLATKLNIGDRILIEAIKARSEVKGEFVRANLSPIVITAR